MVCVKWLGGGGGYHIKETSLYSALLGTFHPPVFLHPQIPSKFPRCMFRPSQPNVFLYLFGPSRTYPTPYFSLIWYHPLPEQNSLYSSCIFRYVDSSLNEHHMIVCDRIGGMSREALKCAAPVLYSTRQSGTEARALRAKPCGSTKPSLKPRLSAQ